jgi:hypothetical protein
MYQKNFKARELFGDHERVDELAQIFFLKRKPPPAIKQYKSTEFVKQKNIKLSVGLNRQATLKL